MFNTLKITELLTIARTSYPQEACGFLLENSEIYQCQNNSPHPTLDSLITAEDYAAADALGILAIYHSHTQINQTTFSAADAKAAQIHQQPIVMVNAVTGTWQVADPTGKLNLPYEGRIWLYGVHDCYALIKDYLFKELAISLPNWPRGEEHEWLDRDFNPFLENYKAQGFQRLPPDTDLQHGDLALILEGTHHPSHLAVICDPVEGHILHQLAGQPSRKDVWGGHWQKSCYGIFRYQPRQQPITQNPWY
jgi:proteasome lid subunit RPN8/RPN11